MVSSGAKGSPDAPVKPWVISLDALSFLAAPQPRHSRRKSFAWLSPQPEAQDTAQIEGEGLLLFRI